MRRAVFAALILSSCCFEAVSGCTRSTPEIAPEMRDVYGAAIQLYRYVWDQKSFADPKSAKKIDELLGRLITDFHRVESKAGLAAFEPGFTVTLQAVRQMLVNIRNRFDEGAIDYANWRLRGLAATCISCHTRFKAPVDFLGDTPQAGDNSFDSKLSVAQFLVATRQFDKASLNLYELAKSVGRLDSGSKEAFRALQLWLVVQVRVKAHFGDSLKKLESLSKQINFNAEQKAVVESWMLELKQLDSAPPSTIDPLTEAQGLVNPVTNSTSATTDNMHLVKTLQATSLLHELLQTMPLSDKRRKATFLLATAYVHMPIETFEVFPEMYLEQCVREFPNSIESRRAFDIYEDLLETQGGGRKGLNLAADQLQKLKELRSLAYGNSPTTREQSARP